MKILLIIICLVALSIPSLHSGPMGREAAELWIPYRDRTEERDDPRNAMLIAFILGYAGGIIALEAKNESSWTNTDIYYHSIDFPENIQNDDLVRVVLKYAHDHPETGHVGLEYVAVKAWVEAYGGRGVSGPPLQEEPTR